MTKGKHTVNALPSCISITKPKNNMAVKHYEAPNTVVSGLSIIVNGRPRRLNFNPISIYEGSHTGKGSMLVTDNPSLQAAIESCALFGKRIFLFREENEPKKEANATEGAENEPKKEAIIVKADEVSSLNDAREYLVAHFGANKKALSNTKAILNVAAENNVVFEALQK